MANPFSVYAQNPLYSPAYGYDPERPELSQIGGYGLSGTGSATQLYDPFNLGQEAVLDLFNEGLGGTTGAAGYLGRHPQDATIFDTMARLGLSPDALRQLQGGNQIDWNRFGGISGIDFTAPDWNRSNWQARERPQEGSWQNMLYNLLPAAIMAPPLVGIGGPILSEALGLGGTGVAGADAAGLADVITGGLGGNAGLTAEQIAALGSQGSGVTGATGATSALTGLEMFSAPTTLDGGLLQNVLNPGLTTTEAGLNTLMTAPALGTETLTQIANTFLPEAATTAATLATQFGVPVDTMTKILTETSPEILDQIMKKTVDPSQPVPPKVNPNVDPPVNPNVGFNPLWLLLGALAGGLGGGDNEQDATRKTVTETTGMESRAPDSALIPYLLQTMQQLNKPPEQAYFDAVLRPLQQAYTETALPGILSQAGQAGQVGGSRQGVAQGIAARGYTQTVADTLAKLAQDREKTSALFGSDLAGKWFNQPTNKTTTENVTQSANFGDNRLANVLGGALMGNQLGNVLFPQTQGGGGGGGNTLTNWLGSLLPSSQTMANLVPNWLKPSGQVGIGPF